MTALYVILAIVVLLNAFEAFHVNRILSSHQKTLEWFAENVHFDNGKIPGDIPKEISGLVGKEPKK
jgi:hypothetical protein